MSKDAKGFVFENYKYEQISLEGKKSVHTFNLSLLEQKDSLQETANLASQYQPKGFTLDTVDVKIKQPFLLKGQLR